MHNTKKMQVYELLKERIESGSYPPGSRLPKEQDLAVELAVSRVTLRSALELLEIENLIRRVKGQGTFVRDAQSERTRLLAIVDRGDPEKPDYVSDPFLYILPCLQVAADRMNTSLEICEARSLLALDPRQCSARIIERGIQGIFWLNNFFTGREPLLETVRRTRLPVLLPHSSFSDAERTGFTVMGTNYGELTRDGLRYLADMGHRRVAFIGSWDMHGVPQEDYLRWVREAGLDPDPELLRIVPWRKGKQLVFDALGLLMKLTVPPTAILAYSDYLSLQIYEFLHREKIRIPEDVAVLSIGGQICCDFLSPSLSALDYCSQEIADLAVKAMLEMIHDRRRFDCIVTPHCLKVRESTKRAVLQHDQLKSGRKKRK